MREFLPDPIWLNIKRTTIIPTKISQPDRLVFGRSNSPCRATIFDIMPTEKFRTRILAGLLATIIGTDLIVAVDAARPLHVGAASFPECSSQTAISCCTKTGEGACWRTACDLPKHLACVAGGLVPTITECWKPVIRLGSTSPPTTNSPPSVVAPMVSQTVNLTSLEISTSTNYSETSPAISPGSAATALDTAYPSSPNDSTASPADVTATINYTVPAEPSKSDQDGADQRYETAQSISASMQSWTTTYTVKYSSSYLTTVTTRVDNFEVEEVFTYLSVDSTDPGVGRVVVDDQTTDSTSSSHNGGHLRIASSTGMIGSRASPYAATTPAITQSASSTPSTSQTDATIDEGAFWTNSTMEAAKDVAKPTRRLDQARKRPSGTFAAGHGRLPTRTSTTTRKSTITATVTIRQSSDTRPVNATAVPTGGQAKTRSGQPSYQPTAAPHNTNGAPSTSSTSSTTATDLLRALRERRFCRPTSNNTMTSTSSGTASMPTVSLDPSQSTSTSAVSVAPVKRASDSGGFSYERSRLQGGACTTCGSGLLWKVVGTVAVCGALGAILAAI